ncbi:MAG: hypothetical protein IH594_15365 [Bacteroidales bacterium]|nr:hypothetical protein [Bacteroidales bacterium]
MNYLTKVIGLLVIILLSTACGKKTPDNWSEDFNYQKISSRPELEVCYTDSSRESFIVSAEEYELTGLLKKPHLLIDKDDNKLLWFEMEGPDGTLYSSVNSGEPSRINLYRRGPYFCEVHWFDFQLATEEGIAAPLKGDLTLYCYPEKMLAEIKWYRTGEQKGGKLFVKGIAEQVFSMKDYSKDTIQGFSFPLFGEEEPLPASSFKTLVGEVPFRYDHRKGYYVVGTHTSGSFQKEFFETPNRYETASFTVTNDDLKRKIYICHESAIGGQIVEGGMVLNDKDQPMPILVQVSKNFPGEKEEKFYNPEDTAFSETFFPLYLEPGETTTLTSLHLYQNWGRHMTKHWSSLGAWMDYFHSSTGVTETTCYVPFKFAGIGGVSIADFRAMSQETFWSGQPQHDNLAGHSFLSFFDGNQWQHLKYVSTIYRNTGPNWFDIQMNYISADGSVKVTADIWETPQADELRSFFKVKYEILKPLEIEDAQADFRFLTITSAIQRLRFTRFACNSIPDMELDFSKKPFPVKGVSLPKENAWVAEYGDFERQRGSNAIIIRSFSGPEGIGPAVSMQLGPYKDRFRGDREPDTRLLIVPDTESLSLKEGDVFEIDGYWLPYGPLEHAETPRREIELYGNGLPAVLVEQGTLLSDLPLWIKAENNSARFTITGGKDYVPVIITGLTDWKNPRIWQKEAGKWRLLSHARNNSYDGYQVFVDEEGFFGAVFLVHTDENSQELKVTLEKKAPEGDMLTLTLLENTGNEFTPDMMGISDANLNNQVVLHYPVMKSIENVQLSKPGEWKSSEGNSRWYHSMMNGLESGGRVTPNNEDLDMEFWWQFHEDGLKIEPPVISLSLQNTDFEDANDERTWVLTNEGWKKLKEAENINGEAIAVQSADGKKILAMVWDNPTGTKAEDGKIGIALKTPDFDQSRRYFVRGKVYLFTGDLDALSLRISREMTVGK